ncbi:15424_t:CDS:2, partial [Cetraspora pellucida]
IVFNLSSREVAAYTHPEVGLLPGFDVAITERLMELVERKFQLNYDAIIRILYLFENRLEDIGETLMESFMPI